MVFRRKINQYSPWGNVSMEVPVTSSRLLAITLFAVPVALFAAGASAQTQNTRDCKYYGICNNQAGYSGEYSGYSPAPARPTQTAPAQTAPGSTDPSIHSETGLVGPHGVGWY
jgi:hypothetical protein